LKKGGFTVIKDLIRKNRSYRRFYQDTPIRMETLKELVDLARISNSGANKQPLKYILCCDPDTNAKIFDQIGWAGALKDWPGPSEGERPTAYIIVLVDPAIGMAGVDHGIACTNILLGAVEKGLGGCMLGTVKKKEVKAILEIDDKYEIVLTVALGKPKETVQLDAVEESGATVYWRDDQQVHHVPKRKLEDVIVKIVGK
jgi:nitroreductase